MLIVFGGLPGTGKSAIARAIAKELGAVYLRIDTIEQSLRDAGLARGDLGPTGYIVGYNVALDCLRLGLSVVSDSVNPLTITRNEWRRVAMTAGVHIAEIEVRCSDEDEHRRRVETRAAEVEGLQLPTWEEVLHRQYEPWDKEHIAVDTAGSSLEDSVRETLRHIQKKLP